MLTAAPLGAGVPRLGPWPQRAGHSADICPGAAVTPLVGRDGGFASLLLQIFPSLLLLPLFPLLMSPGVTKEGTVAKGTLGLQRAVPHGQTVSRCRTVHTLSEPEPGRREHELAELSIPVEGSFILE